MTASSSRNASLSIGLTDESGTFPVFEKALATTRSPVSAAVESTVLDQRVANAAFDSFKMKGVIPDEVAESFSHLGPGLVDLPADLDPQGNVVPTVNAITNESTFRASFLLNQDMVQRRQAVVDAALATAGAREKSGRLKLAAFSALAARFVRKVVGAIEAGGARRLRHENDDQFMKRLGTPQHCLGVSGKGSKVVAEEMAG
jgi:hypothetical protein